MRYLSLALLPLLFVACTDQDPVAPDTSPLFSAAGPHKQPISGFLNFVDAGNPAYVHETPSGICHVWDWPGYYAFDGDVVGPVTFYEDQNLPCVGGGHLTARGPFEGEVTWDGHSGKISGMWTTNCKSDASQPAGIYCDGTMNGQGSEGLDGFHFHFKWGQESGWLPFDYSGTVHYK